MTNDLSVERTRFTGRLIERGADGYEAARMDRVYHSRHPERYPAAILLAETENDVVEGVRLAKERGWQVGIRSGGHSFPVWGVRDDALLVDMGRYKEMSFDPDTGIVSVTPSVQGGAELGPYLQQHGRFFPSGGCSSVAVGGFLLQGGMGWNHRGWGYAAEQVDAIDVVTAAGELVHADENENSDLFWAARGAGPGFFGAVTCFHLRTRVIPEGLAWTVQAYPLASYARVLQWYCEKQHDISADVHLAASVTNPPFPMPGHDGGLIFIIFGLAFCESLDASAAALAPMNECPYVDEALMVLELQPTSIAEQHAFVDTAHPPALRYRVDSAWVEGDYAQVIAATRTLVEQRPSTKAGHTFFWFTLPRDGADMAMSLQTDLMVGAYIIYDDATEDDAYRDWSLAAMGELEPFTVSQYWGDSDQQHRDVRVLTDEAWQRLKEIREKRDPDNVFVGYLTKDDGFHNVNGW